MRKSNKWWLYLIVLTVDIIGGLLMALALGAALGFGAGTAMIVKDVVLLAVTVALTSVTLAELIGEWYE